MKRRLHPHSILWLLPFALVFVPQVLPRFWGDSLTNDEPMEITNGYFYLTQGDVLSHHRHPPFSEALSALPLLALHLKGPATYSDAIDRALAFFFKDNLDLLQAMTIGGRMPSLLFGLGIGFLIFILTRSQPLAVCLSALGLWAFNPTFSAFSGLALADIPVSFFFLAAVMAFEHCRHNDSWKSGLLAGVLAGMAVTSKFSALVLIPTFLLLELLSGKSLARPQKNKKGRAGVASRWAWGAAGFALWIFFLYLPGTLLLPGHLSPFNYFWQGFMDMASYKDHPVYFMGSVGRENHLAYFPVAFLLKNPLPFLAFLAVGFGLMAARRIQLPFWRWIPGLTLVLVILPVQDLGVRYLLPAFPFFILVAAAAFGWFWERTGRRKIWRIPLLALALFQMAVVGASFPHAISYFNELVPAERKLYWLGDSNLDISQDLGRLSKTAQQRGWKKVKLAYFGGSDPSAYGIPWEPWRERDLKGPEPGEVYAVNAGFFQLAPTFYPETLPIATGWLSQTPPTGQINDTWYYFEVPGNPTPAQGDILFSAPFQQHRGYAPAAPP